MVVEPIISVEVAVIVVKAVLILVKQIVLVVVMDVLRHAPMFVQDVEIIVKVSAKGALEHVQKLVFLYVQTFVKTLVLQIAIILVIAPAKMDVMVWQHLK